MLHIEHIQSVTTCLALAFACLLCFVVLLFSINLLLELVGQMVGAELGLGGTLLAERGQTRLIM